LHWFTGKTCRQTDLFQEYQGEGTLIGIRHATGNLHICAGFDLFGTCLLQTQKIENLVFPTDTTKKYALIWSEEFNYAGLPDSMKWREFSCLWS